jgi:hypothetical protein
MKLNLRYRGHSLTVEVRDATLSVSSMPGDRPPIRVGCGDRVQALKAGDMVQFAIEPLA